jgi:DNA (cytosine-5)-methyltransferase 1
MNHKEKLLEIYDQSFNISDIKNIPNDLRPFIENITKNIDRNKGVYTVLVTLMVHKLLYPKQDIRYFQSKMKKGFSARTIDAKYITPTLKEIGLSSMAESGWLTRSLEQPYPYTLEYEGEISGKGMKEAFLKVVDVIQNKSHITSSLLRLILNGAIILKEKSHVQIKKISSSDEITIETIVSILEKHFAENYSTHGGSKLPVLAFYAIYIMLIAEIGRYKDCELSPLASHTASDRTSKSSGDIEVRKNGKIYETVEVKLDKIIDITMTRIAYEKILRFNPERYYILSYIGISEKDHEEINDLVSQVKKDHGCQLIINGLLHTLKYYLRLISSTKRFLNLYIEFVENDTELMVIHKTKLKELLRQNNLS